MGGSNTFLSNAHTYTHDCDFSLGDFSNFLNYLPTIILGKFNKAVPCKQHCSTWLEHLLRVLKCLPCLMAIKLIFFWEGGLFCTSCQGMKLQSFFGDRLSQGDCDVF